MNLERNKMKPENVKCPECDGPMIPRTNKTNNTKFWGCRDFPVCKGTRDSQGMSKQDKRDIATDPAYHEDEEYRWDR
jgi:ssDNA-binding Zn-finger/Zn-ribbon topoisomerase 1